MGVVVLFSRLSPYFVLMEGTKSLDARDGSRDLPDSDLIDKFSRHCVAELAAQIQAILESVGLVRLFARDLEAPLGRTVKVPTVLTVRAFFAFDALFYWED